MFVWLDSEKLMIALPGGNSKTITILEERSKNRFVVKGDGWEHTWPALGYAAILSKAELALRYQAELAGCTP